MLNTFLFTNLNSGRNIRNKLRLSKLRKLLGNKGHVFATHSVDELEKVVSDLHTYEPGKIIIDGGDGTWTTFLSLLMQYWPSEKGLPCFGILPGGTYNLMSKACGVKKEKRYLQDIVSASSEELYYKNVNMIKIKDDNGLESYGFSFGVGTPVTLLEEFYKYKRLKNLRIGFMFARVLFSKMFRQKYYDLFNTKTRLSIKPKINNLYKEFNGDYLGMVVQSFETVGLPFSKPFYKAQLMHKHFHAMGTTMDLGTFLYYVIPFYFGKPVPGMDLDVQTNELKVESEMPFKYQVNGELGLFNKQFSANSVYVSHGINLKIIKASKKVYK